MRAILATVVVFAVLGGGAARAAAPVEAGKVFSSTEGEQVAVIPLTPVEDKKVLLHVQGTGSEFDGKVLPHELYESGTTLTYSTELRGRDYGTLRVQSSGSRRSYTLYVPGRGRNGISVTFDEARTKALKADEVYALHQKQKADGTLTKLMAFDQKAERAGREQELAESVKSLNAACDTSLTATIDWSTIPDEVLKKYSVSSYCEPPLGELSKLCKSAEGKKAVQVQAKEYTCRFGDALKLETQAGKVTWTTAKDESNQEEFVKKTLLENLESARGQGEKLAERLRLEKIRVCADGRGHYVVVQPDEERDVKLSYGDGKRFVQVAPAPWGLSGHDFLEPRFFNPKANASFRGHDMRVYSEVELDEEKKTCAVRCGTRTIPFTWVDAEKAEALVRQAKFEPNPQKYVPYALLRDQQGRYYLVERGFQPEEQRNFRVSIGPKGNLQPQKMTDIVSDSEGEIFSTKKGELRLVLDKAAPSTWIENSKKLELRTVPVSENLPLIYNELGVYTGARLGTPCDDQ